MPQKLSSASVVIVALTVNQGLGICHIDDPGLNMF